MLNTGRSQESELLTLVFNAFGNYITPIITDAVVAGLKQVIPEIAAINIPKESISKKRYTVTEVCDIFRITEPTLRKYTKSGFINREEFGRRKLYSQEEIDRSHSTIISLANKRPKPVGNRKKPPVIDNQKKLKAAA